MPKGQLILVSNRLPVTVTKVADKLEFNVSSGGLASALSALPKSDKTIWVGWPGIAAEELTPSDKRTITQELAKYGCLPVYLTSQQINEFYEGYSNSTIWPLFHYFPQYSVHSDAFWTQYRKVGQIFARAIARIADPDATIWVHDYHLLQLPKLLRAALPGRTIGLFLHIPFPSYEIFRQLPQRKDILSGMLGADLVGFHIYDYAVHFAHSVERLLGNENSLGTIILKDRMVQTDVFPIGIDYDKFARSSKLPAVKTESARLKKHFKGQKIILSMDRLDYSKGILNRLEAFDTFLQRNPATVGKVVLAVVAIPSRTKIEAYQTIRENIEKSVSRINGKYGTVDWTPISYQYKNLPFEQIAALYNEAQIAFVTPLRDGMNLVAKEFVATKGKQAGVLILSELAGAVDELPEATQVNPNDRLALAKSIEKAIAMPLVQQRRRLRIMQMRISKYNARRWAEDFLEQLAAAHATRTKRSAKTFGRKEHDELISAFKSAKRRLVMLDYDGTLVDFVSNHDPEAVKPTLKQRQTLKRLSDQAETTLAIISGRPKAALKSWFGDLDLVLSAEHGAWMKLGASWTASAELDKSWKAIVLPILLSAAERTPGSSVEGKDFAIVWHYRNVTPDLAYVRTTKLKRDLKAALKDLPVDVYEGHKIIEVKPRIVTKGAAVSTLIHTYPSNFLIAIGDDYSDEDMFTAMPELGYTIKVGAGETKAKYSLPSIESVHRLITELSKL